MKTIVVVTASAIALASCASEKAALREGGSAPFSATSPNVYLLSVGSGVRIAVDQEPLAFQRNSGTKKIKWKLHDNEYKLQGIVFQPDAKGNNPVAASPCSGDSGDDSVFSCDNDTSVAGTFKYTIYVTPKRPELPAPDALDPTVVNY